MTDILRVRNLVKHYEIGGANIIDRLLGQPSSVVRSVDSVSFNIAEGETLGLVGESGCGKSTVGRSILRLVEPTGGSIELAGQDITNASERVLRPLRQDLQVVFQDPFASLNPRRTVGQTVAEPMGNYGLASGESLRIRVQDLFERVGLRADQVGQLYAAVTNRHRLGEPTESQVLPHQPETMRIELDRITPVLESAEQLLGLHQIEHDPATVHRRSQRVEHQVFVAEFLGQ